MNSSLYKSIKRESFEFFNKTQIAVIDSKILFEYNNEESSSKVLVQICNEIGLWIGDDFKCKLEADNEKTIFQKFVLFFHVKRTTKLIDSNSQTS